MRRLLTDPLLLIAPTFVYGLRVSCPPPPISHLLAMLWRCSPLAPALFHAAWPKPNLFDTPPSDLRLVHQAQYSTAKICTLSACPLAHQRPKVQACSFMPYTM